MSKDKRIKACPNAECSRNTEKYRYKATDKFCTICGEAIITHPSMKEWRGRL